MEKGFWATSVDPELVEHNRHSAEKRNQVDIPELRHNRGNTSGRVTASLASRVGMSFLHDWSQYYGKQVNWRTLVLPRQTPLF